MWWGLLELRVALFEGSSPQPCRTQKRHGRDRNQHWAPQHKLKHSPMTLARACIDSLFYAIHALQCCSKQIHRTLLIHLIKHRHRQRLTRKWKSNTLTTTPRCIHTYVHTHTCTYACKSCSHHRLSFKSDYKNIRSVNPSLPRVLFWYICHWQEHQRMKWCNSKTVLYLTKTFMVETLFNHNQSVLCEMFNVTTAIWNTYYPYWKGGC